MIEEVWFSAWRQSELFRCPPWQQRYVKKGFQAGYEAGQAELIAHWLQPVSTDPAPNELSAPTHHQDQILWTAPEGHPGGSSSSLESDLSSPAEGHQLGLWWVVIPEPQWAALKRGERIQIELRLAHDRGESGGLYMPRPRGLLVVGQEGQRPAEPEQPDGTGADSAPSGDEPLAQELDRLVQRMAELSAELRGIEADSDLDEEALPRLVREVRARQRARLSAAPDETGRDLRPAEAVSRSGRRSWQELRKARLSEGPDGTAGD